VEVVGIIPKVRACVPSSIEYIKDIEDCNSY